MTAQRLLRLGLAYLVVISLQIGVWALLAPRRFYDDFPGLGRSWVSADGPYNEHLVRDVGALNLALAVLLLAAAWRPSRDLVLVSGIASLAWGLPHLAYHVVERDLLDGSDQVVSLGGLAVFVGFAGMLVATAPRLER